MTLNYFNFNLPLLEPELHHFYGIGGKNVGEFPILYYLAAQLYGLFNQTEMWLRLLNLSIFSIGLYCLYSTIFKMTKNLILAFCGPLLILTSTIIIFYANNFLPDVPSLGLVFISFYFYYQYHSILKIQHLIIASVFISLAGLVKTTALITAASIGIVFIVQSIEKRKINLRELIIITLPFLINLVWILYAKHYKSINENTYLMLKIKPIWNYSNEYIHNVWIRLTTNQDWGWKKDILPPTNIWLTFCSIPFLFFLKINKYLKTFIISSLVLSIIFILLMYPQFYHHDYYFIHITAYFTFSLITVIHQLYKVNNLKYFTLILVSILTISGVFYSKKRLENRYFNTKINLIPYFKLKSKLESIGIKKETKILNISDNTYCASLYALDRKGWTNLNFKDKEHVQIIDRGDIKKNLNNIIKPLFAERILKGAEFLIVKTNDTFERFIPTEYKRELIFEDSDFLIYKL